jgi:regulator of protease activity HflC (stomatin/prohibitin superfamily)
MQLNMQSLQDRDAFYINGFVAALLLVVISIILLILIVTHSPLTILLAPLAIIALSGFTVVSPNEAKVLTFFGKYIGTIKENGFLWTVPFSAATAIPLKILNFNTEKLKVNDFCGNPIEVGAVVVWRISDAAQACFNVDDYKAFIFNQSESVVRTIVARHPYDSSDKPSLRGNAEEITKELAAELHQKLSLAGISVEEVKLSHLAYAPEIASSMLKRQQAVAVMEARKYLVENATVIVEGIISNFVKNGVTNITDDKKADIMSRIMVTLISDKEVNPVIGVG